MQLSKLESKAYETFKKNNLAIFKTQDLMLLLNIKKGKAYNLIKALKKKNAIQTIKAGLYSLKGANELEIGSYLNWPSYLSFWSALSYYKFTDQLPKTAYYATTRFRKRIKNFKYITISRKRFFGYKKSGAIIIADKEKALVDSLLFPKYAGGIREIINCIETSLNEIELDTLCDYALKVESKAVLRRLGFILEYLKYKGNVIERIRKNIGRGYERLDPSLDKRNNLNKEWLLDINDDIDR
ncbi:MAG TPA: hypothetical protein VJH97_03795 [Candidatus Nanoarchaeia archaeon]|nr:hypothetical protein [Candidatus Nanoarchaeia archaeon]